MFHGAIRLSWREGARTEVVRRLRGNCHGCRAEVPGAAANVAFVVGSTPRALPMPLRGNDHHDRRLPNNTKGSTPGGSNAIHNDETRPARHRPKQPKGTTAQGRRSTQATQGRQAERRATAQRTSAANRNGCRDNRMTIAMHQVRSTHLARKTNRRGEKTEGRQSTSMPTRAQKQIKVRRKEK